MEPGKYNLLLIEDEEKLTTTLKRQLDREGFNVEISADGIDADKKLQSNNYHMVVLDLNLPGMSGIELLEEMRKRGDHTPVLILSARDKVEDRVKGLNIGADDYLVKPFDITELTARIRAVMNRAGLKQATSLKAADLVMDLITRTVKRANQDIALSPKEFSLLEFLIKNKNQVITSKRIAEQVWGYTFDTGTNIVNVYINYLRKNIDTNFSKKLIHTIRGQGFILIDKNG